MDEQPMSRHSTAASIGLPYPPYLRKVIRRSAGMWLLVRCAHVVALLVAAASSDLIPPAEGVALALRPGWATRSVLVGLAAVLVWLDRRRSHELLLPANLGAWSGWFWGASLLTALASDIAVQTFLAAF